MTHEIKQLGLHLLVGHFEDKNIQQIVGRFMQERYNDCFTYCQDKLIYHLINAVRARKSYVKEG